MIIGISSGIPAQLSDLAPVPATMEAGLIFGAVLAGKINGSESATSKQEERTVFLEPTDTKERPDPEVTEGICMNFFPFRFFAEENDRTADQYVPAAENGAQRGTWLVSVAEKQQLLTDKVGQPFLPVHQLESAGAFEAGAHPGQSVLTDAAIASEKPMDGWMVSPINMGTGESRETANQSLLAGMDQKQVDHTFAGPTITAERESTNSMQLSPELLAADRLKESATLPQMQGHAVPQLSATSADAAESHDPRKGSEEAPTPIQSDLHSNQTPLIRQYEPANGLVHKPSKVTVAHMEAVQRTVEMQIEKTPMLGTTIVKIRLNPDNIGDIHVQVVKDKDSISAILQVGDAETKSLLDEQLPLLMEPFKHSGAAAPIKLTVVADPSLSFSFSEGTDSGSRKTDRQESRKKESKEKAETKDKPTVKLPANGLSLLA